MKLNKFKTRSKMKNKGMAIILDSLMALVIVIAILGAYYSLSHSKISRTSGTEFKRIHYTSEDVLEVFNKEGVLDDIGEEWAESNGSQSSKSIVRALMTYRRVVCIKRFLAKYL